MVEHMRKHADIIRPKFEAVEEILERELGGLGIGQWTKPKGGYFISFDSLDGCAKDIVAQVQKGGCGDDRRRRDLSLWKGSP